MFIGAGPWSVAKVTTSFGLARSIGELRSVRLIFDYFLGVLALRCSQAAADDRFRLPIAKSLCHSWDPRGPSLSEASVYLGRGARYAVAFRGRSSRGQEGIGELVRLSLRWRAHGSARA
jgi:hypothetical protein